MIMGDVISQCLPDCLPHAQDAARCELSEGIYL